MDPIEHVWDALGRRVAGPQPPPQTLQELERALLEEWVRIPQLVINSHIDSMPQRKASQSHHRASASAQDRYLALSARRHRRTTAPQLARDLAAVSGRRISRQTVNKHLKEIGLYARLPVVTGLYGVFHTNPLGESLRPLIELFHS
ncbi:transposable element Tcb2 transposase [Trichonephila clavipes]|uniref:Transposable element Tcb2 transposase n=1 Tax=Trichonephila clavipes TaxID=2585209 RepID=A0A8X6S1F3_TRICX|nr:transposable element Tcb2 transposase [Trichonephila clavipes]